MSQTSIDSAKKPIPNFLEEAFTNGHWENEPTKAHEETLNNIHADEYYINCFKKSQLSHTKAYSPPAPVLTLRQNDKDIPLLTRGSISLLHGKHKSRKTTLLALIVAAMIRTGMIRAEFLRTSMLQPACEGLVIYFDTEQGESYAAKTLNLILKLAGVAEASQLIYCNLRDYTPEDRLKIIEAAIRNTENVALVVIDGLIDLLSDHQGKTEAHPLVTELLRLTSIYKIHILVVLHQNRQDNNPREIVGLIASQKAEMEFSIEVDKYDKYQSAVKCVSSRGIPFDSFAIRWEGALPEIVCWGKPPKNEESDSACTNFDDLKKLAEDNFKPGDKYRNKDLLDILEDLKMGAISTRKRIIVNWLSMGIFTKSSDKKYSLNVSEGSQGSVGPN